MKAVVLRWLSISVLMALILGVATAPAGAHDDMTYEDLVAKYGDWTREDVEAAGYVVQPVCVEAADVGLPAELGGMGFHAINKEHAADGEAHTSQPDVILLDEKGQVLGVEYEIPEVVEPAPVVAGQPLVVTPPHHGMEYEHMSLHIFFVGDEEHRYGSWNPAVSCPDEATGAGAAPEGLPETGRSGTGSFPQTIWWSLAGLLIMGCGILLRRHRGGSQRS